MTCDLRLIDKEENDITCYYVSDDFLELQFEIIEKDTIASIEELEMTTILDSFISTEHQTREIKAKINEIIRKVNKLDKQFKELNK